MPDNFQVICGSKVGENRQSPASTEIPGTGWGGGGVKQNQN